MITKLKVDADQNVKFNLKYDGKNTSFTTYTSGINEFCFKIICKNLAIEVSSNEQTAQVKKVMIDYYEY